MLTLLTIWKVMIVLVRPFLITVILSCFLGHAQGKSHNGLSWKVGLAKENITPKEMVWLAGFAHRTKPATHVLHDIWVKAMAMEDEDENKTLILTVDLNGIPRKLSDEIKEKIREKYGLTKGQILINASHTHSGPVLKDYLPDLYPMDSAQIAGVSKYTEYFIGKVLLAAYAALDNRKPAFVSSGEGAARFQVNRRNNSETILNAQKPLNGPNDYAVPVIKITDANGNVKGIIFSYACHPSVISGYGISGDYSGFAQKALELKYPGAIAVFLQGAGGDQGTMPRGTVAYVEQYGHTLAESVSQVLKGDMDTLESKLLVCYKEIDLELNSPPSKNEIAEMSKSDYYFYKKWVEKNLNSIDSKPVVRSYSYPIQIWKIGKHKVFAMGGEPVIDYAVKLKQIFGRSSMVIGYSNDVMAYIPSVQVLNEGGYEGATSQIAFGLPGTWKYSIESTILRSFIELAESINMKPDQRSILGK